MVRRGHAAAVALAVLAAVVALSASASAAASPVLPTNDSFYVSPRPLADVAPGTVLRTRSVTVAEGGTATPITATQVLYRTADEAGQPSATVATVVRAATQPVSTKIVSYQTAYDALGSQCDPSYTLQGGNSSYSTAQEEEQVILAYVAAGDTVVVPDYEGENLDWAAGQESGYDTLDGIRAAEGLLGVPAAGTPVAMIGYSGGSIATDFAAELAPSYAPRLDIVGVAEGGLPVDFFHNLSYINGSPSWSGVIPAVLVSLGRAFGVSFQRYLSPYGVQVTNQVKNECINDFVGSYPGLTIQKLLLPAYQDYLRIPDLVRITDGLIMGRTGTPRGPLFMGVGNQDGTGDGVMVAADVRALAHAYCARGVSVQLNEYSGDDHDTAAVPFEAGAMTFIAQRLNGAAVSNGCGSIGPGNSLAPLPVPVAGGSGSRSGSGSAPAVRFHSYGRVRRLHGIDVKLWTRGGALRRVVVVLSRGRRRIGRFAVARLTGRHRRFVFRLRGRRMPGRGRYTLVVRQGGRVLLRRTLVIR